MLNIVKSGYIEEVAEKLYQKIYKISVYFLIVSLPFYAFVNTVVRSWWQMTYFSYLKEVVLGGLIMVTVLQLLTNKEARLEVIRFAKKNWLFGAFLAGYLLIVTVYSWQLPVMQALFSLKYEIFFWLFLVVGLAFKRDANFEVDHLLKWFLGALGVALGLGLVLHFVVKPENLTIFGYRPDWSTFYANQALAFCQKVEHSEICRFQGTFAGPNQAGLSILTTLTLLIYFQKPKMYQAITAVLLGLTLSRSAILAGMLLLAHKTKKILIVGVLLASLGVIAFPETVLRTYSNSERLEYLRQAVEYVQAASWRGHGAGFVGPVTHFFGEGSRLTENWFLQVWVNFGLLGLICFAGAYWLLVKKLLVVESGRFKIFGWLLICLLIPLNLLHSLEDSVFSYSLFLILGLILSESARGESSKGKAGIGRK